MSVALYTHVDMLDHRPRQGHFERPERLAAVTDSLSGASDLDLEPIAAPLISTADLVLAHDPDYVAALIAAAPQEGILRLDEDTEMSPGTLRAALRAAGAATAAVRSVAAGETDRAFCAVRPPGHHAGRAYPLGFCLFSNVAVAARAAQAAGLQRVAVADFDVHHGNGTQDIFETDPDLFFASIHQSPNWPGTGDPSEHGVGNVFNAVVAPHAPREAWRAAFETLMDRMDAFAPDIVIVSAGFDAHRADPLAELDLEEEDFGWATRAIVSVANRHAKGRVVSSLEGGYDLQALGRSALAHVRALHGG